MDPELRAVVTDEVEQFATGIGSDLDHNKSGVGDGDQRLCLAAGCPRSEDAVGAVGRLPGSEEHAPAGVRHGCEGGREERHFGALACVAGAAPDQGAVGSGRTDQSVTGRELPLHAGVGGLEAGGAGSEPVDQGGRVQQHAVSEWCPTHRSALLRSEGGEAPDQAAVDRRAVEAFTDDEGDLPASQLVGVPA